MKDQMVSVGELARISGLTIRTLQYYDTIGLLPASGKTEDGRRLYTAQDTVTLEQIVFYKNLGFPLEQIRQKLLKTSNSQGLEQILSEQSVLVFNRMELLHNISAVMEAYREILRLKKDPPWTLLISFLSELNEYDISDMRSFDFTDEQLMTFTDVFHTVDEAMGFYHRWKTLLIQAAAYNAVGIAPSEPAAQNLAGHWIDMAKAATGGKEEYLNAYLQVNQRRETWPKSIRALMETADKFVSDCCKIYCVEHDKSMLNKLFDRSAKQGVSK